MPEANISISLERSICCRITCIVRCSLMPRFDKHLPAPFFFFEETTCLGVNGEIPDPDNLQQMLSPKPY